MAYAPGQMVEVCLEFDVPHPRGVRRVVAAFVNEHGDVAEFSDVPDEASDCVLQEPTQIALHGRPARPGSYKLERLQVEHLSGTTPVEPPSIGFEVKGTPRVVGWRLT